ncbi:Trafficking protein particle complex subunit 12 [Globomyces sp. JEL0801]|nr:Trafficking protein particle complex subunit 12 [Globomyces sp. JEL0801]
MNPEDIQVETSSSIKQLDANDLEAPKTPPSDRFAQRANSQKDITINLVTDNQESNPFAEKVTTDDKPFVSEPTNESTTVTSTIDSADKLNDKLGKSDSVSNVFSPKARLNPVPAVLLPIHYQLPTRRWVDSSVFYDLPYLDNMANVIAKVYPNNSQRPKRAIKTVEQAVDTPDPYATLVNSNSWRSVALLARNDIIACHPANVDELMRLYYIRWSSMIKLRLYDIVQGEMDKLRVNDSQDLFFEKYPDVFEGRKGLMISFDVLVLIHKLPSYKKNIHESIHRFYKLLCPQKPTDFRPTKEQHIRILFHIINLLIQIPDISLAIQVEVILGITSPDSEPLAQPLLDQFARPDLVLFQRGAVFLAKDLTSEAINMFTQLITILPDSSAAMNNLSIAQLYSGNVSQV